MATVSLSLPDEMKEWLDERVKNSRYATASDYMRDLIRRDHDERSLWRWSRANKAERASAAFGKSPPPQG